jgi:phosphate-selective porin OprO/OprP
MGGMLHLGANYQHRDFQSNNGAASISSGAPSTNQLARYRARPFLQTTGERFVDTGSFAAHSDDIMGVELGGIFGPFHVVGEAQWTKVNAYKAGDLSTGLAAFPGGGAQLVPTGDPTFFSWYAEAGYFLTGESRGYKNGMWDRTKVAKPFGSGGIGAVQINARYDYLDLTTGKLQNGLVNDFATGVATPSVNLVRGGKQEGYMASLIWIPMDYVRVLLQYTHTEVTGGPLAATVNPTSLKPVDQRGYGVDSGAMRVQFDF